MTSIGVPACPHLPTVLTMANDTTRGEHRVSVVGTDSRTDPYGLDKAGPDRLPVAAQ